MPHSDAMPKREANFFAVSIRRRVPSTRTRFTVVPELTEMDPLGRNTS
jgi:hypothetical protein